MAFIVNYVADGFLKFLKDWSVGAAKRGGAATQFFKELHKLVTDKSPLDRGVELLSILNRPTGSGTDSRKNSLLQWFGNREGELLEHYADPLWGWAKDRLRRLQASCADNASLLLNLLISLSHQLGGWVVDHAALLGGAVYRLVSALPAVQFFLLGSQWGSDLQPAYSVFKVEAYWAGRLDPTRNSSASQGSQATPAPQVQALPSLLVSLLLSRVDFVVRFLLSLVYGSYWIGETPVTFSLVAYLDIPDDAGMARCLARVGHPGNPLDWPPGTKAHLKDLSQGKQQALDNKTLQVLVECAWLAYEEDCVVQHVMGAIAGQLQQSFELRTFDFYSIIYKKAGATGDGVEHALDTQCFVFRSGNVVILSFRGSQPLSLFDWAYNFAVSPLRNSLSSSESGSGGLAEGEEAGRALFLTVLRSQPANNTSPRQGQSQGPLQAANEGRVHEGFSKALGLSLRGNTDDGYWTAATCKYLYTHHSSTYGSAALLVQKTDCSASCSPYTVIESQVLKLMKGDGMPKLFITGHSLGGALGALFATRFLSNEGDMEPNGDRVSLVTFGQPQVGDATFADRMGQLLGNRYARVVNHNDVVPRVPTYFTDRAGSHFEHAAGVTWYIDQCGVANKDIANQSEAFSSLAFMAWEKLRQSWRLIVPRGASTAKSPVLCTPSSLRLLVRGVLTPLLVVNDHVDYKLLMRHNGYWADAAAQQ